MRRVLLIGGEAEVLEGLKKSLRVFSQSWDVEVSPSAEAALTWLRTGTIDAIIVESRGVADVEAFLRHAGREAPRTVRAVLTTGEVDASFVTRLVASAHQVIKKPVIPAQLFELVERTCAILDSLASSRLKTVLGTLGSLPALPQTYARLAQLTADPDATLDAMAGVVERDPGITANVLRIINSAYFGLPRRVASVREAVRYLGIQPLKNIVLSVEVFEGFAKGKQARALQMESLARACAMREVLGHTPLAEAAFAAGILSDVGHLLLTVRLPIDAMAIQKELASSGRHQVDVELERLGATHAEIGGALLGLWNLPMALVEAVVMHHTPAENAPAPTVSTALALVCALEEQSTAALPRVEQLEGTIARLAQVFPMVNVQAVRRQLAPRGESVA